MKKPYRKCCEFLGQWHYSKHFPFCYERKGACAVRRNIYLFSFIVLLSLAICVHVWAAPFAYIANSGSDSVSVIDTATNTVVGPPIPVGSTPIGVAVNPAGTRVYVANSGSNSVSVIDTATNTVIGSPIPVGGQPIGVAVTPTGTRVYVANFNSNTVSVIDTASNTVTGSPISVGEGPQAFGQFIVPPKAFTIWTGTVSFPLKLTTPVKDAHENTKFNTSRETFEGVLKMFISEEGPQPDENGCYILLETDDDKISMCFKEMAAIATDVFILI
jgi:YVTN family beta-propeller protein